MPSDRALLQHHPFTVEPLWKFTIRRVGSSDSYSASFSDSVQLVQRRWRVFLEPWELKRYFIRPRNSVVLKHKADVVVVHPDGALPASPN